MSGMEYVYVGQTRNGVSRLDDPNRLKDFWNKALAIYDTIPKAVDERSELAANGYSKIGENME